jgi:4-amino-4-deoxy-L-arabinose transferase-like glycosyltransferase
VHVQNSRSTSLPQWLEAQGVSASRLQFWLPVLVCIGYIMLATLYMRAVPLLESSDEAAHFLYVHNLLKTGQLPVIESRAQIADQTDLVRRWSLESHQPPLYYAIGALLISPTQRDDIEMYLRPNPLIFLRGIVQDNANKWLHPVQASGDTATAVWILRLYSLSLSTGTLVIIYRAARLLFDWPVAIMAIALVASMPTYINIGSSVNNDNLVVFLYSVGIYVTLLTWRDGLQRRYIIWLSLILSAIALTKITGLTLFAVVGFALLLSLLRPHWTRVEVSRALVVLADVPLGLAGWWYLRNWNLYGDPIASAATQALWGREFAKPLESAGGWVEINRIWQSFWAMVGHLHQPVYAPGGVYLYVTGLTLIAVVGLLFAVWRGQLFTDRRRYPLLILLVAMALPVGALLFGTRSIDISYGRLLFPALIGFVPLLVYGLYTLLRQLRFGWFTPLLVLQLTIFAAFFALEDVPRAYPRLEVVDALPSEATPVDVSAGGLTILGYESETETNALDSNLDFSIYISGSNEGNPALFVTALDPITQKALATSAVYPGGAATDALSDGVIYHAPISIELPEPLEPLSPRQLRLQLGWQTPLDTDYLPLTHDGAPVEALVLDSAVLLDPRYEAPAMQTPVTVEYGNPAAVTLEGYTLSTTQTAPGESITLTLRWRTEQPLPDDEWVLTAQLLDPSGELAAQDDGDLPGYPAAVWLPDAVTIDERVFRIPADAPEGEYRVLVGWYRLSDLVRLPARLTSGEGAIENDLFVLPVQVNVE